MFLKILGDNCPFSPLGCGRGCNQPLKHMPAVANTLRFGAELLTSNENGHEEERQCIQKTLKNNGYAVPLKHFQENIPAVLRNF